MNLNKQQPNQSAPIVVGDLDPFSAIDYPDHLSAVIFCQGCPLRCPYCFNQELQPRHTDNPITWDRVIEFLNTRRTLLDAVVFSGGEPTQQPGLIDAVKQVKDLGFKIGLHTSGVYPNRLQTLLPFLDWIGLDIKTIQSNYDELTGMQGSGELVWQSAQLIINSNIPYQFRTTLCPNVLTPEQQEKLLNQLNTFGDIKHTWQECYID